MVLPGQDDWVTLGPVLTATVCPPAKENAGEEGGKGEEGRQGGGKEGEGEEGEGQEGGRGEGKEGEDTYRSIWICVHKHNISSHIPYTSIPCSR